MRIWGRAGVLAGFLASDHEAFLENRPRKEPGALITGGGACVDSLETGATPGGVGKTTHPAAPQVLPAL